MVEAAVGCHDDAGKCRLRLKLHNACQFPLSKLVLGLEAKVCMLAGQSHDDDIRSLDRRLPLSFKVSSTFAACECGLGPALDKLQEGFELASKERMQEEIVCWHKEVPFHQVPATYQECNNNDSNKLSVSLTFMWKSSFQVRGPAKIYV